MLRKITFIGALFYSTAFATNLPDGHYILDGVACGDNSYISTSQRVVLNDFDFQMIQANVSGRPSLSHYWWGALLIKQGEQLTIEWRQLHNGNATNDERNHTPFYTQFTTVGVLKSNQLTNMHLLSNTIEINYLIPEFNGQRFSDEDITSRLAKDKHMGAYSTQINVQEIDPERGWYLFDEQDGFGAPRHLLCGAVDAHMSMILQKQDSTIN